MWRDIAGVAAIPDEPRLENRRPGWHHGHNAAVSGLNRPDLAPLGSGNPLASTPAMPEAAMRTRDYEELTVDRWRTEPHWANLQIDEPDQIEQAPPLWKDLTLASVIAAALWAAAILLFN
jgi:hypothetical protein